MGYQTSFYMHIIVFAKLIRASERTGRSIESIIKQVMRNYAKDHKQMQIKEGTVKYQERDEKNNWKVFRIALDRDDYELFTDMRKVMKKSVSYLVALAVDKYLDLIISKILKNIYVYMKLKHLSLGNKIYGFINWVLTWRIYKEPIKKRM